MWRRTTLLVLVLLCSALTPEAQQIQAARVRVRAIEAAVRLAADASSAAVALVRAGTVLEVRETRGDWYGVFVPADDDHARRYGFIPVALVEPVVDDHSRYVDAPAMAARDLALTPTAFVFDRRKRTVSAVDAATGHIRFAPIAAYTADGDKRSPDVIAVSPDGSRLIVIDPGPGNWTLARGWQPARKSDIVIIDATTLDVVARADGVWGAAPYGFSKDGQQLVVFGPGVGRLGDRDRRPSELVALDVRTGAVQGRITLDPYLRRTDRWFEWYSDTALSPDREHLYVLDRGRPSDNRQKHVDGRVSVISLATLTVVRTLAAGGNPRGLIADAQTDAVYALSDHAPYVSTREQRHGELRVLRGAEVVTTIAVSAAPRFTRLTPDGERLLVITAAGIDIVDTATFNQAGRVAVPRAGVSAWTAGNWWSEDSRMVNDLVMHPDGRRGYAIHEDSSQLSIVDLDARKRVATITTGRASRKLGAFVNSLTATMASYSAGQYLARVTGSPVFFYSVYYVLPAHTEMAMRPDGRFVYVLNWQTEDLTIVDTGSAHVLARLPNAGRELQVLEEANLLSIKGPRGVTFIDMTTHREVEDLAITGAVNRVVLSPDRRRLFVASSGRVVCLDARTGRLLAVFPEFDDPTEIVFAPAADRRSAIP